MIEVKKVSYDENRGTEYYDIKNISNWDLQNLFKLLKAEESRSIIVAGFFRGSKELLEALEPLAHERDWVRQIATKTEGEDG